MIRQLFLVSALFIVGCSQSSNPGVSHVVLCWLKQPGNVQQREQLIETSKTFKSIPGVQEVRAGVPIASARPIVDSTYDVGIVMRFKDQAAMETYQQTAMHQQALRDVLGPLSAKILIYDISER